MRAEVREPAVRYRMDRPLGRGGMGAVYLTHDALLDRVVALKRAHRYGPLDLLRFKREFRAIERLVHPNLVRLYELGSDEEGLYYTMEAIEGADLAGFCAGRPERLRRVLPQLLDALAFLHAHGVIHCDLKPSNVLVANDGTLKLLDFGVLAELSSGEGERIVAGTPAYLAPERIRGEPATPATDLYALGCTLFEILAGRPPFVGSIQTVLSAHLGSPPPACEVVRERSPARGRGSGGGGDEHGPIDTPPPQPSPAGGGGSPSARGSSPPSGKGSTARERLVDSSPPACVPPASPARRLSQNESERGLPLPHARGGRGEGAGTTGPIDTPPPQPSPAGGGGSPSARGSSSPGGGGSTARERLVASEEASTARELEALVHALLAKRPEERPSLDEVRAALGAGGAIATGSAALVGRDALSRRILERLEEGPRPLVLAGPSGVGKTTLLEHVAAEAQRRGALVFRSASRSTERLAYNALDAAMDDLARVLMQADRPIDPRAQRIAAEAFPLLRPSSRSTDDARELVRERLFGFRETLASFTRREVFDAIGALFDAVIAERGGLLVVDDFQWADADSLALMRHLLERTSAALRVVLVVRSDVEPTLAHAWLRSEEAEELVVPPLATHDALAVVRRAAEQLGATVPEEALEAAARACEGRPFLAEVAGRALARGSRATLDEQLADAWARHGELLSLLVTEDGWTPVAALALMLGRSLGSIDEPLAELEQHGLVRRSGGALDGHADLYHDGVRRAALARLGERERAALHARVADHLLESDDAPPARVVRHLVSAGRAKEAAPHARNAAALAERQRAFSAAADMYGVVLAAEPGERDVREARAWALERSSRHAEAASEWARLAAGAPREDALDLALHEAHALIAASRTGEGIRRLDAALAESGQGPVRVRGLRALGTVARFVAGPGDRRRAAIVDRTARVRAERNLKIGLLLAFFDPLTGMSFLQRARADFLDAGAEAQVAGCDLVFAVLAYSGSRDPDRVPLAERYLASAEARARGVELPPEVRGMIPFVHGVRVLRQGRWVEALAGFGEAEAIFGASSATSELALARSFSLMTATQKQEMHEARRIHDVLRRHAADTGGSLGVIHTGLVGSYLQLLEGRLDEANETLRQTMSIFPEGPPNAQHAALRLYSFCADIYRDDCARARRELAVELKRARPFRFLSTMHASNFAFIEAMIEANALRVGDRGASLRRIDRLAELADAAPPFWAGGARRARAYAADALGRPDEALLHLGRAEEEAARFERHVDVAIARWQRGTRLGGDEGAALRGSARALVESLGVSPLVLEEDAGRR